MGELQGGPIILLPTVYMKEHTNYQSSIKFSASDYRTLVGRNGVVSSYNFPLDYTSSYTYSEYQHGFKEFEDGEVKEICLQFKR